MVRKTNGEKSMWMKTPESLSKIIEELQESKGKYPLNK